MSRKPETKGLLQPLNLAELEERGIMFNRHASKNLTMLFYLIMYTQPCASGGGSPIGRGDWDWDWEQDGNFADVIRDIAKSCIAASEFPNMDCEVIMHVEEDEGFAELDWVPTDPIQSDWALEGMHILQLGFKESQRWSILPDPVNAIYAAMTTYDRMYLASGKMDPMEHTPLTASERESQAYRLIVNDVYREGIAIWFRDLVNLRNEIMVKLRAKAYKLDPDAEWKKFCDASGRHFLDYLRLWQPPEQ